MMECIFDATTSAYLPKKLATLTKDYQTDAFDFDYLNNTLNCKLFTSNPYRSFFQQIYPDRIEEDQLTDEMINVLRSYTDSRSNECFKKTNLNLLSANYDEIDWTYVNQLRSLIRGLVKTGMKQFYYRGLHLSDREIQYYLDQRGAFYYTNSFTSFTTDRLLIYSGNALMILRTNPMATTNLANIWRWSSFKDEKEALLAVGAKLKVLSVHYFGCKWEIEVELMDDDQN